MMLQGWKFPIELDEQTGKIKTISGDQEIREAIKIILTTRTGERIGTPQFGSNLFEFMFASINYTELKEIEYEVNRALKRWEPRIRDLEVRAQEDLANKGKIFIDLKYRTEHSPLPVEMSFHYEVNEGISF